MPFLARIIIIIILPFSVMNTNQILQGINVSSHIDSLSLTKPSSFLTLSSWVCMSFYLEYFPSFSFFSPWLTPIVYVGIHLIVVSFEKVPLHIPITAYILTPFLFIKITHVNFLSYFLLNPQCQALCLTNWRNSIIICQII